MATTICDSPNLVNNPPDSWLDYSLRAQKRCQAVRFCDGKASLSIFKIVVFSREKLNCNVCQSDNCISLLIVIGNYYTVIWEINALLK